SIGSSFISPLSYRALPHIVQGGHNAGMHKSRLATFVIDCETKDLEAAARFWSAALGRSVSTTNDSGYLELATAREEPQLLVQKVPHPSRIHVAIESDKLD